jgi:hypothetical protein
MSMMRTYIAYTHDESVVDIGLKYKLCHMTGMDLFYVSIFQCKLFLDTSFFNE